MAADSDSDPGELELKVLQVRSHRDGTSVLPTSPPVAPMEDTNLLLVTYYD